MEPFATALTATAIADLAFKKFMEAGAGELGKQFTTTAIAKMDELRQKIWDKLRGKSEKLDQALKGAEDGDTTAIATIAKNLDVALDDDEAFAHEVKTLVQVIEAGRVINNVTIGKQINISQDGTGNTQSNTFSL